MIDNIMGLLCSKEAASISIDILETFGNDTPTKKERDLVTLMAERKNYDRKTKQLVDQLIKLEYNRIIELEKEKIISTII